MHKKAVSLMGGSSHTSQNIVLSGVTMEPNFLEYQKVAGGINNMNSQKQSYVPSSQTSFNDYNSANNNYQEIRMFPKVDNFVLQEKNGSLLLAHQQQQMKTFSKALQESQLSQQTFDQMALTQDTGMKSFDQKPPLNHVQSSHQSQRLSIVSDSQQQSINPGYRSHANSFKGQSSNIAMKHPPNKYIKGGTNVTESTSNYSQQNQNHLNTQTKSKKTLQYHHQRTFSDNPSSFSNNSKQQLFNANATGQVTNRNFQDLIRSVNNKEQILGENFINPISGLTSTNNNTQDIYPLPLGSLSNINSNIQGQYNANKTTIGSSRQSAQSQALIEERDAFIQHYQGQVMSQDKYNGDINSLYSGQIKDQFQKTKQALKITQQQFGGPSRKVVQNTKLVGGNANTQSYRMSTQNTLTGSQLAKVNLNNNGLDPKSTPKLNLHKASGKSSTTQSQNASAHGARASQASAQINQQLLQSEKIKKQKALTTSNKTPSFDQTAGNFVPLHNDLSQQLQLQTLQKTGQSFHKKAGGTISSGQQIVNHKRSASDNNPSVFMSLSNRAQIDSYSKNQTNINIGGLGLINNSEMIKTNNNSAAYSKQQSMTKINPSMSNNAYPNIGKANGNEYNIISERQVYNQSTVIQSQNNVVINSHRKINVGQENTAKHQRHNSEQIQLLSHQQQATQNFSATQEQQKNSKKHGIATIIPKQNILMQASSSGQFRLDSNNMIIQDQSTKPTGAGTGSQVATPSKDQQIKLNTFNIQQHHTSQTILKPVEERVETQESVGSDPSLTPRSRMVVKINKKIKLAFQKAQNPHNPQAFTTSTEFYKIGKVMGKGAFGKVNLAIHRLANKFVALKSINKQFLSEEASKRKVMQEFNILRRTRHRNIVRLYESFETQQHIVFVMEVCGAGDLLTYVRRRRKLKEDVAKHMFKQIIEGLRYCHSKSILHRDIKLDNILLTSEGDIKICDFGVSKLVKPNEIMTEQCGTPAYIAPEVFENRGYEGYASDVWSAGVVLYAMLYGTVPFKANNMTELQKQITKCQTTFKDEISAEAISLLKSILERDPVKRFKIQEILKHPWMSDIPEKVSVFTEQEKDKTHQEFAYYNFKPEGNGGNDNEIVHTDPFTEQMLNSTQNSLIKNASTKSVILAPFNSTRSHIDDNFHMRKSIQDLLIDKKNIKFAAKVKEIDRQYEANNNAELDNGVYHQDSEEEKKDEEDEKYDSQGKDKGKKKGGKNGSIETSFDKDDGEGEDGDDEYGVKEENKKKKKQSEWQKLEQMVIERQKTEEEEEENDYQKQKMNLGSLQTLVLEDRLINEIEKSGFPKQYVINSLNNDELNYVTTYYYLLTIQKEY